MLHGTMTRAAEMLRMSQPAVSTTIAALEHSIGLTLFVRRGSRLHPTPEAQLFYVEASKALDAIEGTVQAVQEIRSGRRGSRDKLSSDWRIARLHHAFCPWMSPFLVTGEVRRSNDYSFEFA